MPTMNPFLAFIYARGLRLGDLAKASGVPVGSIFFVSAGRRRLTEAMRKRLAPTLGCGPEEIPDPFLSRTPGPRRREA